MSPSGHLQKNHTYTDGNYMVCVDGLLVNVDEKVHGEMYQIMCHIKSNNHVWDILFVHTVSRFGH